MAPGEPPSRDRQLLQHKLIANVAWLAGWHGAADVHQRQIYFTSRADVETRPVIGHVGLHFDVATTG